VPKSHSPSNDKIAELAVLIVLTVVGVVVVAGVGVVWASMALALVLTSLCPTCPSSTRFLSSACSCHQLLNRVVAASNASCTSKVFAVALKSVGSDEYVRLERVTLPVMVSSSFPSSSGRFLPLLGWLGDSRVRGGRFASYSLPTGEN
jgi:hypothetical protein